MEERLAEAEIEEVEKVKRERDREWVIEKKIMREEELTEMESIASMKREDRWWATEKDEMRKAGLTEMEIERRVLAGKEGEIERIKRMKEEGQIERDREERS